MAVLDFTLRRGGLEVASAQAIAVPVAPGDDGVVLSDAASSVAEELGLDLAAYLAREGASGDKGQVHALPLAAATGPQVVLAYGLGAEGVPAAARKAGAALVRRTAKASRLTVVLPAGVSPAVLRALVEGAALAAYSFTQKPDPTPKPLIGVDLVSTGAVSTALTQAFEQALATARAVHRARDLINTPSLTKTPAWLADQATRLGKAAGLDVTVLDEEELAAQGFGGILTVGQGSTRPPRLIRLDYTPAGKARGHVVLVGKGITFDTGGLSIKPNEGMIAMKTDMGGGAAVIGAMTALRELGVKARVTGFVAAAENMPSGTAVRPGDVITHWGGITTEVLNTDAEGRLVLADALAFATQTLRPDAIVNIATLTGAMPLGLGKRHAGLFSTSDDLAARLEAAGSECGERMWRMPLTEEYRDALESPVADLANIGRAQPYQGGSITAALFLREFVGATPWAHLDIAGTGRSDAEEDEITKGGTGYGVRTFLRLLETWR